MQSLLGDHHRLPLFNMAKGFICLEETKERIKTFLIGYMINPALNINKAFREQVNKFIKTTFCTITQHHHKTILAKNKRRVLSLIIFSERRKILRKFSNN